MNSDPPIGWRHVVFVAALWLLSYPFNLARAVRHILSWPPYRNLNRPYGNFIGGELS